jgi:glycerate dehydrogenase
MHMPTITVLDGYTTNPGDLAWDELASLGTLTVYDRTPPGKVVERAAGAGIVLTNKTRLDENILAQLPKLRCISVLATGYDVVDVQAARARGITVCNVRGYASGAVAQHVFAFLLEFMNGISRHDRHVQEGGWAASPDFSYTLFPTRDLAGKTLGIYGFGQIGQQVATVGQAFGMHIVAHHSHPQRDARPGVTFLSFEEMLKTSDVVTLHAPLSGQNEGIINRLTLSLMKPVAVLINTGRGGLINEPDLKWALENEVIAGAGLDVLSTEPPASGHVLIGTKNCILTPHNAWATKEARQRLLRESAKNIRAFLAGNPVNVIQ